VAMKLKWRSGASSSGRARDSDKPISESAGGGKIGRGCILLFFGVFFVAGALMLWFLGIRPVMQVFEARSWPEVPCTVTSSQVESHSDSDGTTYSIDIRYTYEIGGETYPGDRYNFSIGSSSGYNSKQKVVDRYPPGTETVCRVDPEDPTNSVIDVDFSAAYLWGLFGLPFFLVGLLGGLWMLRKPRPAEVGGTRWMPHVPGREVHPKLAGYGSTGPLTLQSTYRPIWRFVGILLFAGLWNAMVYFLLWPAARDEGGCIWVFLAVFGLAGLMLLISVPYTFLAMFNPRPVLTMDSSSLALGESTRLSWSWSGGAKRIDRLRISLEGQEEATYRRGTDTHTDKHLFARIEVLDTPHSVEIGRGSAELVIPADTMHSFESSNNKIVWRLKVQAEISRWPDVGEEHKLVVQPKEAST